MPIYFGEANNNGGVWFSLRHDFNYLFFLGKKIFIVSKQKNRQKIQILMTERGDAIIFCSILAPPMPPPPLTSQYLFILMTERGRHYLLYDFGVRNAPPPPTTPQY